jgi:hypothetical protein
MSEQHAQCPKPVVVGQLIRTETRISVEPTINQCAPRLYCLESHVKPYRDCDERPNPLSVPSAECTMPPSRKCTFVLTQLLCVEVPIEYGINIGLEDEKIHCGRPSVKPCELNSKDKSLLVEENTSRK